VIEWTRAGLAELLATLDEAAGVRDPDTPVKTWAGDQPPIFWPRRMAIETAVHRWDAQAAAAEGRPIGTDLALAAVDEMFEVVLPWRGTGELGTENEGKTMHLHATDVAGSAGGEGEWLVTLGTDGLTVAHTHAKGDVAVRGTASDLLLLLWNRVPADRCEVFGDAHLLEEWRVTVKV
jgi:MDMPI C-terminal domain/Mycothiol maleylpyruvate isomerase N-terminal domain